jgi:hypothetical protein
VPHKVAYFTIIDPEIREAMRRYKAATGMPEAQQIHRALTEWLNERPEAWMKPSPPKLRTRKGVKR